MNYTEFAAKIKTKYPQYRDMPDMSLAQAMVKKYPGQYDDVDFSSPVEAPLNAPTPSYPMTGATHAEPFTPGQPLWTPGQNMPTKEQNQEAVVKEAMDKEIATNPALRAALMKEKGISPIAGSFSPYLATAYLQGRTPTAGDIASDVTSMLTRIPVGGLESLFPNIGKQEIVVRDAKHPSKIGYPEDYTGMGRKSEDKGTSMLGSIARDPRTGSMMMAGPAVGAASSAAGLGGWGTAGLSALGMGTAGVAAGQALGDTPSNPVIDFIANAIGPLGGRALDVMAKTKLANAVASKFAVPVTQAMEWVERFGGSSVRNLANRAGEAASGAMSDIESYMGSIDASKILPFLTKPVSVLKKAEPYAQHGFEQDASRLATGAEEEVGTPYVERMRAEVQRRLAALNAPKKQAEQLMTHPESITGLNTTDAIDELQKLVESKKLISPRDIKQRDMMVEKVEQHIEDMSAKDGGVTLADLKSLLTPENLKAMPELREWVDNLMKKGLEGIKSTSENPNKIFAPYAKGFTLPAAEKAVSGLGVLKGIPEQLTAEAGMNTAKHGAGWATPYLYTAPVTGPIATGGLAGLSNYLGGNQ